MDDIHPPELFGERARQGCRDGHNRELGVYASDLVENGPLPPLDLRQIDEQNVNMVPDEQRRRIDERARWSHFEPLLEQIGQELRNRLLVLMKEKNSKGPRTASARLLAPAQLRLGPLRPALNSDSRENRIQ